MSTLPRRYPSITPHDEADETLPPFKGGQGRSDQTALEMAHACLWMVWTALAAIGVGLLMAWMGAI